MAKTVDEEQLLPTLEELILSLQKSVARASEITSAVTKYDQGFLQGDRTVYHVKELDFVLKAGLNRSQESSASIRIDLGASPDLRSTLTFRIEPQVYQKIEGPSVIVSKFRSLESDKNRLIQRGMVWVINELGKPEPNYDFSVILKEGGLNAKEKKISNLKTDVSGRLKFLLDAESRTIQFDGAKEPESFSLNKSSDWYMWATIEVDTDGDDVKEELHSEIIQMYYP